MFLRNFGQYFQYFPQSTTDFDKILVQKLSRRKSFKTLNDNILEALKIKLGFV